MNRITTWAAAAALMATTLGLQAAGPLAPALQARLGNTTLPALAPLSSLGGPSVSAAPYVTLPTLPVVGSLSWMEYNINFYPGQARAWVPMAREFYTAGALSLAGTASRVPSGAEACDHSNCPMERRVGAYANNLIDATNGALGLSGPKVPAPPLPFVPFSLPIIGSTPYWITYNYYFYPFDLMDWAGAEVLEYSDDTKAFVRIAADVRDGVNAPQAFLGDLTDGALGLAGPKVPAPPLPFLPTGAN